MGSHPHVPSGVLLNPHSRCVKIDACLLQFSCHMTSDVKFWHMIFFLFTLLFKSFILRSNRTSTIKQILIFLETVVHRCFSKQVFLKTCNFVKKRLQQRCFPVKFAKFLRKSFFHRISPVAAFVFFEMKK